jgi:phage tail-like protein
MAGPIDPLGLTARRGGDPVGGWNFTVSLVDATGAVGSAVSVAFHGPPVQAGFSECQGLEAVMAVEEYREGGRNDAILRFPGRVSWSPIRLRRGVVYDNELLEWFGLFVQGRGQRRDGVITLRCDTGTPVRRWRFTRGLPSKWTGPALAAASGALAIEELEIQHEGLLVEGSSAVSQVASSIGALGRLGR